MKSDGLDHTNRPFPYIATTPIPTRLARAKNGKADPAALQLLGE